MHIYVEKIVERSYFTPTVRKERERAYELVLDECIEEKVS